MSIFKSKKKAEVQNDMKPVADTVDMWIMNQCRLTAPDKTHVRIVWLARPGHEIVVYLEPDVGTKLPEWAFNLTLTYEGGPLGVNINNCPFNTMLTWEIRGFKEVEGEDPQLINVVTESMIQEAQRQMMQMQGQVAEQEVPEAVMDTEPMETSDASQEPVQE